MYWSLFLIKTLSFEHCEFLWTHFLLNTSSDCFWDFLKNLDKSTENCQNCLENLRSCSNSIVYAFVFLGDFVELNTISALILLFWIINGEFTASIISFNKVNWKPALMPKSKMWIWIRCKFLFQTIEKLGKITKYVQS